MSGSGARRRPGEETDQCAAEWKASNTLLLTRPKHFEACFHREQLVGETAGVKLTLPAPPPSPLPPRELLDDTFIWSRAPAAVAPACSRNGAHPRQTKCSSLPPSSLLNSHPLLVKWVDQGHLQVNNSK